MGNGPWWACGLLLLALGCGSAERGEAVTGAPEQAPGEPASIEALAAGDSVWLRTTQGGNFASGTLVRGDASGNSYMVFRYETGTRIGGTLLPGNSGVALVSHSPSGQLRWVRPFVCTDSSSVLSPGDLWVTPGGRSLLVLNGACTVDFGGGPSTGRTWVVAIGAGGQHRWSRAIVPLTSGLALTEPQVTVSPTSQTVLVAGSATGILTAEGTQYGSSSSSSALLLRYTDRGSFLGARELAAPAGALSVTDVAYDGAGRLLALFGFAGTVDLGGGPRVAQSPSPILVARFTATGRLLWDYALGGAILARALATSGNRVVVAGEFEGSVTFRGRTFTATPGGPGSSSEQGFVFAVTRVAGAERWLQLRGRHIDDVAMDAHGGVTVIGRFSGLGPSPNPSPSATFVARYDSGAGLPRWRRVLDFGGVLASVGVTPSGTPLVTGQFGGSEDLGTGPITASPEGSIQAFVMRLSNAGQRVAARDAPQGSASHERREQVVERVQQDRGPERGGAMGDE